MFRPYSKRVVVVVGMILVLGMSQAASAQRGRRFVVPASLASLEQVQNELNFSDEQKAKANEIAEKLRSDRRDLFQQGFSEDTRQKMQQLGSEASAKVFALLDDAQSKRLMGISFQVMGARVLNDPIFCETLNVTEEQGAKLDEVRAANQEDLQNAFMDYSHLSGEERRAKFSEIADKGDEKLLAVLTDEQRQQLEDMKGAPLDVDLSPLFPRRRGN